MPDRVGRPGEEHSHEPKLFGPKREQLPSHAGSANPPEKYSSCAEQKRSWRPRLSAEEIAPPWRRRTLLLPRLASAHVAQALSARTPGRFDGLDRQKTRPPTDCKSPSSRKSSLRGVISRKGSASLARSKAQRAGPARPAPAD